MKRAIVLPLICSIIYFISGCANSSNFNKNILAGYAEYQNCLKECDSREAAYTAEYNKCYEGCPADVDIDHCFHIPDPVAQAACITKELEPATACLECMSTYTKHMKEVEDCRKQCLIEYDKRFEVLEQ
jgi:hypothetical protein